MLVIINIFFYSLFNNIFLDLYYTIKSKWHEPQFEYLHQRKLHRKFLRLCLRF